MRSRRTMSPMTIVVVRDEPAGSSEAGPSVFAAGFAASAVAGAGADVVGAPADAAVAAVIAVEAVVAVAGAAVAGGEAVCCDKAEDETRRARRRAGIAERRFMTGETTGLTGTRQAAMERA
jgi:hypothetical protein